MKIVAYTTAGCYYCKKLKELFDRAEVEYTLIDVVNVAPWELDTRVHKNRMAKPDFEKEYPGVQAFPFVVIDEKPVGSLVPVAKFLLDEGLVSARKG